VPKIPYKIINSKILCKKPISEDITIVSLQLPIAIGKCPPKHKICGTNEKNGNYQSCVPEKKGSDERN